VSSEKDCFRQDQVAALVKTAEGDWRTAVMLGYFTGARLGDCANMTWESVNFEKGLIDYVPQKTKKKNKRVVVPMHPELRAHLEALRSNLKAGHICPSLSGRDTGGKSGLSEAFRKLMQDAGIKHQLVNGKGKRKFSKLSFHSLRHSFNSALANSGVDQETRMKLTGHSSVDINKGYTHLDVPKLQQAIALLPSLTASSSTAKASSPAAPPENTDAAAAEKAA
jgi:integrase